MKNTNRGIFLRKYDSINMGLAAVMIFGAFITLIDSLYGRTFIYQFAQIVYLLFFLNALPAIIKNISKNAILVLVSVVMFFIFSEWASPMSSVFDEAQRSIILWSLPYFILGACITDFNNFVIWLRRASLAILAISVVQLVGVFSAASFFYSQELGYGVLPSLTLYSLTYVREWKTIFLFPVAVSIVVLFASGSRGPLLCALLFFVLTYVVKNGISKKLIATTAFLVFSYFVLLPIFMQLFVDMISVFSSNNFSTRSLELLVSGEIGADNEREELRKAAINYIQEHPFIGSGIINDRIIIAQQMGNFGDRIYGSYCHNFFLEIMMQFGLIPGILILIIFIKRLFVALKNSVSIANDVIIFAVSIGLFPLLVSRSWITFSEFYLLIGVLISYFSVKRHEVICKN